MSEIMQVKGGNDVSSSQTLHQGEENHVERPERDRHSDDGSDDNNGDVNPVGENVGDDVTQLTGRKKKLYELKLKMVFLNFHSILTF